MKTKEAKTTKVVKIKKINKAELDKENIKRTVKTIVQSNREIKYKYPEDLTGVLERKAWRQKTRSKLENLELQVSRAQGPKELKAATTEFKRFRKEVLLVP